jgi:hypothetical protein
LPARGWESHRRSEPSRVPEGRQIGPVAGPCGFLGLFLSLLLGGLLGLSRGASRGFEALLNLAEQIFEIVDLAGQRHGFLPLGVEGLFGIRLLFLSLVDQKA